MNFIGSNPFDFASAQKYYASVQSRLERERQRLTDLERNTEQQAHELRMLIMQLEEDRRSVHEAVSAALRGESVAADKERLAEREARGVAALQSLGADTAAFQKTNYPQPQPSWHPCPSCAESFKAWEGVTWAHGFKENSK